jgi:DNA-binding LacI/PurR family transcriptional regulator
VVGFDNDAEGEYLVPRLTTVDPANDAMAETVIELVLRRIEQGPAAADDVVRQVTPVRLVVRESTRP